jgi:hypothetical protein
LKAIIALCFAFLRCLVCKFLKLAFASGPSFFHCEGEKFVAQISLYWKFACPGRFDLDGTVALRRYLDELNSEVYVAFWYQ